MPNNTQETNFEFPPEPNFINYYGLNANPLKSEVTSPDNTQESNYEFPPEPNFINYYGLNANPLESEVSFYFLTPLLKKSLQLFNYLTSYSHKIIVTTAPRGSGKTAFLEQFVKNQSDEKIVCKIKAINFETPLRLLHEVAEQLDLKVKDDIGPSNLISAIQAFAAKVSDEERTVIIIIDEAQVLSDSVLEAVYRLVQHEPVSKRTIKLILSGEELPGGKNLVDTMKRISAENKGEDDLFFHILPAFSLDECKQYLQACFDLQGDLDKIPFSEEDYTRVHRASRGLPQKIREQAIEVMQEGVNRLMDEKEGPRWLLASAVAISLVAGVVITAYLWDDRLSANVAQVEPTNKDTQSSAFSGTINRDSATDEAVYKPENHQAIMQPTSPVPVAEENISRPMPSDRQAKPAPTVIEPEPPSEMGPITGAENAPIEVSTGVAGPSPASSLAETDIQAAVAEKKETSVHEQAENARAQVVAKVFDQPAPAEKKPEGQVKNNQVPPVYTHHEQVILDSKPSNYTMQMLGSNEQARILRFIKSFPDQSQFRHFETINNDQPWYVLVYGQYPTYDQAVAAVDNLPKELKNQKPWVRRISGIQEAIKLRSGNQ